MSQPRLNRRDAFTLIGVTAAGGTLLSSGTFAAEAATSSDAAGLMPGADVCVLTPEVTEGPYYFDPNLERADITEGRPGVPIRVRLQVVDAMCKPREGARVDIWHADASGIYSGYANQPGGLDTTDQTFMRGTQFTGATGIAEFDTVYPGWYSGRTPHIHFKVFLDTTNVLTGQLFFPDALSQFIYDNIAPYSDRGSDRDTVNATDSIAKEATYGSFAYVKEQASSYLVAMIIGIDPSATSTAGQTPGADNGGGQPSGPPPDGAGGPPPNGASGPSGSSGSATLDKTTLVPSTQS